MSLKDVTIRMLVGVMYPAYYYWQGMFHTAEGDWIWLRHWVAFMVNSVVEIVTLK